MVLAYSLFDDFVSMSARFIVRLVAWTIAASCVGFALLQLVATVGIAILGGPRDPPYGMSFDDYVLWHDSGQWWRDSVSSAGQLAIVPVAIAALVTLGTIRRKRSPDVGKN